MEEKMSYEQLKKLVKNPFYVLNEKQLALLEEYRAKSKIKPVRHKNSFNKHGFIPNTHQTSLIGEEDVEKN